MVQIQFIFILLFLSGFAGILPQTTVTNTSLTDPAQIREFLDATQRLRCICLPSLPIQGCSYNMCVVSSYLKTFIENRIREGMTADEIVEKFEKGFGDSIFHEPVDSVILHFQKEGNQKILAGLRDGFGKSIYANPDSTWINLSLAGIGIASLIGIGYYLMLRKKPRLSDSDELSSKKNLNELADKYLKEI